MDAGKAKNNWVVATSWTNGNLYGGARLVSVIDAVPLSAAKHREYTALPAHSAETSTKWPSRYDCHPDQNLDHAGATLRVTDGAETER